MGKLEGKVAIITGASAGIGLGLSKRFAKEGAIVAMCARTQSTLDQAAAEVQSIGGTVIHQTCDVTSNEDINSFVEIVLDKAGTVDILVNNAAYMPTGHNYLEGLDEREYLAGVEGAIHSTYRFMQRVFPIMKEKRSGKIVNFSSIGGIRGVKGTAGYAAGKMAIVGISRVAANEWGKYGINVNCVAPMSMTSGWSELMKTLPEGSDPWEAVGTRSNALGYVGDPEEDIGPPVVFLASDDAKYITGHLMPLDGGLLDLE